MRQPIDLDDLQFMSDQDDVSPTDYIRNPQLEDDMDCAYDTGDLGVENDYFTANFEYNIFETLTDCWQDN